MSDLSPKQALQNAEDWHKKNHSKEQVDVVKKLLKDEFNCDKQIQLIPILHNPGKIYLQFCGWSINLYNDGTWCWKDTTG